MEIGKFGIFLGANTKQFDAALRRSQTKMGGFGKSANNLGRTVAGMFGAFSAAYLIRDAFTTIKDFEQANADLAAVLGTTQKGVSVLTADAERLGATTAFTATQVSQLQKEFGKLGFSQVQILDTTEATLNLAAATGTDLAEAAAVAGATVNGFGLEAKDTGHITDVMAKSFSSTALDMESFSETMKLVAPIAKAAGYSLEETTAAAGQLANAGIKGSLAGTALKNIFSELVKTGKPLAEALTDVKAQLDGASTNAEKLAIAEDIVGERSKAALIILTDQIGVLKDLTTSFIAADGAAKAMAETQLNTVGGSITKLSSAWSGFILNLNKAGGEDGVGGNIKKMLDVLTDSVAAFGQLVRYGAILGKDVAADLEKVSSITFDQYTSRFTKALEAGKITQSEIIALAQKKLETINAQLGAESNLDTLQKATLNAQLDGLERVILYYQGITKAAVSAANATNSANPTNLVHGSTSLAPVQSTPVGLGGISLGSDPTALTAPYEAVTDASLQLENANAALGDSFLNLTQTMSGALSNGAASWATFGNAVLDAGGKIVQSYLQQATAAALATAAETGSKTPFGLFLLPAFIGLALGFIKGGISKAGSTPTAFADGGIVSGPTLGLVGEYSGARSNPEVIAPLDKLKSLLPGGGPTDLNLTGQFKIQGRDLVLALNNENVRLNRL